MDSTKDTLKMPDPKNVLFENRHKVTPKTLREVSNKSVLPPAIIIYIVLIAISLIIAFILGFTLPILLLCFLLWVGYPIVILAFFMIILPIAAKNTLLKENTDYPVCSVYFTKDSLFYEMENGEQGAYAYENIGKSLITSHYVALVITNPPTSVVIAKNGFTKGSYNELLIFLRSKGISI